MKATAHDLTGTAREDAGTAHRVLGRLLAHTVTHPHWVEYLLRDPIAEAKAARVRTYLDGGLVAADGARGNLMDDLAEVYGRVLEFSRSPL
jgi:hypothetical protein